MNIQKLLAIGLIYNLLRLSVLFALFSIPSVSRSEKFLSICGLLIPKSLNPIVDAKKDASKNCETPMRLSIREKFPLLEDVGSLKISEITIDEAVKQSGYFQWRDGQFKLVVANDLDEPQYQMKTIDARTTAAFERAGRRVVVGVETIRIGANPYWLWPSSKAREKAFEKYGIKKKGLIADCLYGHAGSVRRALTVTVSGCVLRSNDGSDFSIRDFQRAFEDIRFHE